MKTLCLLMKVGVTVTLTVNIQCIPDPWVRPTQNRNSTRVNTAKLHHSPLALCVLLNRFFSKAFCSFAVGNVSS